MTRLHSYRFLSAMLLSLSSCGGSESPTETGDPPTAFATTLTISPTSAALSSLGATEQLTPTVLDQDGVAITGASVAWSSNVSGVAAVSSSGLVTANSDGTATITATSGTAIGSSAVTTRFT